MFFEQSSFTLENNGTANIFSNEVGCSTKEEILAGCDSPPVVTTVKVFLQGPYNGTVMRDDLRSNGILLNSATTSPYFDNLEMADPSELLRDKGDESIVDWVELQLRVSIEKNSSPITRRSVLVQRNGILVDENGNTTIPFYGIPPGDYYLSVHHRNHLGVMTAQKVTLQPE